MDSSDESSPDIFRNKPAIRQGRSRMEECSSLLQNLSEVSVVPTERYSERSSGSGNERKINYQTQRLVPQVAVQEKIFIFIENTEDKGVGYSYKDLGQNGKEPNTFAIRNEAIRLFMVNKLALAKDTEIAIAAVEAGEVKWLSQLTSDINQLSKSLAEYMCNINEEGNEFNMSPIFSGVLDLIEIPEQTKIKAMPPPYIIRVIFVYSNSHIVPQVNKRDHSYVKFIMSPYCFLDVLYLHGKQSDFNNVQNIYDEFGKVISSSSYVLESSRDITNVFHNAGKLLAHPCQRVTDESMWKF